MPDNYPNAFLVGAGKAGTTALFYYLERHPEIFLPVEKEINYFAVVGKPDFPDDGSRRVNERTVWRKEDYLDMFRNWGSEKIAFDCSPSYLYYPQAAERIHKARPDAKVVILLRQPAERAFSAYLHSARGGSEKAPNFEQALDNEPSNISRNFWFHSHYRASSDYLTQIRRYYDLFPREQIHVIEYQDYFENQQDCLLRLYEFLGIAPLVPDKRLEMGVSGKVRNKFIADLLFRSTGLRKTLRPLVPVRQRRAVMVTLQKIVLKKEVISESTRRMLTEEFAPDFVEIERLTGIDTSGWVKE
jgi:hypothetical protein